MSTARRDTEPSGGGGAPPPEYDERTDGSLGPLPPPATDRPVGSTHMLGPATRMLWRSPGVVHFELGSAATVAEGLPDPVLRALAAPASVPGGGEVGVGASVGAGVATDARIDADSADRSDVGHALTALADAGYLWTRPNRHPRRGAFDRDERAAPPTPRLAGELTALSTRHGERAAEVLAARARALVAVVGTSRTAAHLAALVAAAGVERIVCLGRGAAHLSQAVPGGLGARDEGLPFETAVRRAVQAAAPEATVHGPLPDQRPDLSIIAVDGPITEERRHVLHALEAPYLAVTLGTDHGVVGPLVLPGLTSCLRCADLHRRDRDPAWTALAVQLAIGRRHGPSSQVAVATIVTGVAVQQALTFLDGGEPAVLDATLELRIPDWRLRRRSWPPHPDCDCAQPPGGQPGAPPIASRGPS